MPIKEQGFDTSLANQIRGQFNKIGSQVSGTLSALQEQKETQDFQQAMLSSAEVFTKAGIDNADSPDGYKQVTDAHIEEIKKSDIYNGRTKNRIMANLQQDQIAVHGKLSQKFAIKEKQKADQDTQAMIILNTNKSKILSRNGAPDKSFALLNDDIASMIKLGKTESEIELFRNSRTESILYQTHMGEIENTVDAIGEIDSLDKITDAKDKIESLRKRITDVSKETIDPDLLDKVNSKIDKEIVQLERKWSSLTKVKQREIQGELNILYKNKSLGYETDEAGEARIKTNILNFGSDQQKDLVQESEDNAIFAQTSEKERKALIKSTSNLVDKERLKSINAQVTNLEQNDPMELYINRGNKNIQKFNTENLSSSEFWSDRFETSNLAAEEYGTKNPSNVLPLAKRELTAFNQFYKTQPPEVKVTMLAAMQKGMGSDVNKMANAMINSGSTNAGMGIDMINNGISSDNIQHVFRGEELSDDLLPKKKTDIETDIDAMIFGDSNRTGAYTVESHRKAFKKTVVNIQKSLINDFIAKGQPAPTEVETLQQAFDIATGGGLLEFEIQGSGFLGDDNVKFERPNSSVDQNKWDDTIEGMDAEYFEGKKELKTSSGSVIKNYNTPLGASGQEIKDIFEGNPTEPMTVQTHRVKDESSPLYKIIREDGTFIPSVEDPSKPYLFRFPLL